MSNLFAGINLNFNNAKFEFNFANSNERKSQKIDLNNLTNKELIIIYLYYNEETNRFISFDKPLIVWKDEVLSLCDRKILVFAFTKENKQYYSLTARATTVLNKQRVKKRLLKNINYMPHKRQKYKIFA